MRLDRDGNLGTTGDRAFTFDEILADTFDDVVSVALTGTATATLLGIRVNAGLDGLVPNGTAQFQFVAHLNLPKSDSGYITLQITNVPSTYASVCRYLRLDDILSVIERARDYMMQGFDELPFWVTDPDSPLYALVANVKIPLINKTPRELLGVLDQVNDAVNRVQEALADPRNDVQALIGFILDSLGLDLGSAGDVFRVAVEGTVVHLALKLEEDIDYTFPFDFDLAALTGLVGLGVPGLDGIDSLVDLEGSGRVSFRAFARVALDAGIDVNPADGLSVDTFLYAYDDRGTPDEHCG